MAEFFEFEIGRTGYAGILAAYNQGKRLLGRDSHGFVPMYSFIERARAFSFFRLDMEHNLAFYYTVTANYGWSPGFLEDMTMVTDRTLPDVERVVLLSQKAYSGTITEAELDEFAADMKGAYNATDINRVRAALFFLWEKFAAYGYHVSIPESGIILKNGNIPTASELATYISDVRRFDGVVGLPADTPAIISDIRNLDYVAANNIERFLLIVLSMFPLLEKSYIYSGEAYSGEF